MNILTDFTDDHYAKEDLDVFWSTLYPEIPNGTYPIEKNIDGAFGAAKNVTSAGVESDLDFEAAQPLIWPQKTILFQTDDEFYEVNETSANTPIRGFWNTFYDALDGSYCTYSAFGETGNCVLPECLDPAYPDPNPGGYKGQLQCGVYEPTNVISISYGTFCILRRIIWWLIPGHSTHEPNVVETLTFTRRRRVRRTCFLY